MKVLLVHGLGRTPDSMFFLARALRREGHHPGYFAYSPTLQSLPKIVNRLAAKLEKLARFGQPVTLIGHSLGGLLLRMAIPKAPGLRVHRLIMLATPNRPPRLAQILLKRGLFRWLTRGCGDLLFSPDTIINLPVPNVPYTLIAGTAGPCGKYSPFGNVANDAVVGIDEVPIRDTDDVLLFPAWHTFIMNDHRVRQVILDALDAPVLAASVTAG
ncbi:esterase/lipase family protein [Zavarzinella formosa]|uniref:esterase/lipase family protein n=1 Tax=Zavarzinella formosa TaxID=360055 RepID=UPI0002E6B763|nr:alpha/beta fold hydrolase [Zavarzinella formosa]